MRTAHRQTPKTDHSQTCEQVTFYWILETSRRRCIHTTLLAVTAGLGIGSEILQALLPNGRDFDPFDILSNVVGSTLALLICSWYHRRMLERRRKNKHYDIVPGDEADLEDGNEERDLELGTVRDQGTGVVAAAEAAQAGAGATNVSEELDNWDENADDDWDEEPSTTSGEDVKTPSTDDEPKKRAD